MDRHIDKGVPIPPRPRPVTGSKGKYGPMRKTLLNMAVGDSFEFYESEFYSVRGSISRIYRDTPKKRYTVRKTHPDGRYRVWRIIK